MTGERLIARTTKAVARLRKNESFIKVSRFGFLLGCNNLNANDSHFISHPYFVNPEDRFFDADQKTLRNRALPRL